jgi:hypothetical protein
VAAGILHLDTCPEPAACVRRRCHPDVAGCRTD